MENEKALCKDSSLADEIIDSFALPDRLSIEILMDKFKELMNKKQSHKDLENNRIYRDNITVEDKMVEVLKALSLEKTVYFDDLIMECINKLEAIITFLAILELIKQRRIYVEQTNSFDKIIVRRR